MVFFKLAAVGMIPGLANSVLRRTSTIRMDQYFLNKISHEKTKIYTQQYFDMSESVVKRGEDFYNDTFNSNKKIDQSKDNKSD